MTADRREIDPRLVPELFAPSSQTVASAPPYWSITRRAGVGADPSTVTTTAVSTVYADPIQYPDGVSIEDLPTLFAGDQVLVRREIYGPVSEWAVAFLIRVATHTRRDKRPSVVNHVATVVRPIYETESILDDGRFVHFGPVVDYLIAEALGKGGFQYRRLIGSYGDPRKYSIAITRHKLATGDHRAKMLSAVGSLIGREYGYLKIGAHVLDYALTKIWNLAGARSDVYAFRWLCRMERYPMCSWSSLYVYRKAGLPFSTPLETGSPDDLYDEMRRKAESIWLWLYVSPAIRDEVFGDGYGGELGRRLI